jgi:hypothetical protein
MYPKWDFLQVCINVQACLVTRKCKCVTYVCGCMCQMGNKHRMGNLQIDV